MPEVSIITIARSHEDLKLLRQALQQQSFQDFEFIAVVGGSIPEAWNRAIARARGEILVFTETDATPVNENWLEELISSVPDERTIVKGLEITGSPWDLANLAAHRTVFANVRFHESFKWAEDTELFCQLKQKGYRFKRINTAPVIHIRKLRSKRMIRRAFRYGLYWSRLRHRYADPIEVAGLKQVGYMLLMYVLNLLGLVLGYVIYWPERLKRGNHK